MPPNSPAMSNPSPTAAATAASTSMTTTTRAFTSSSPSAIPPLLPLPHPSSPHPHSILGRPPPNPPPPPPNPQGFLFARCYPHKSSSIRPPDHAVTVANPTAYARGGISSPALPYPTVHPARPFGFPHGDHTIHAQQQQQQQARPQQQHQHQLGPISGLPFSVPRQVGVATNGLPPAPLSRTAPVAVAQPKASLISGSILPPENANFKDLREKNREGSVSMIKDRKVRFLDDASRTLYSLCRSWVLNGPIEEIQSDCDDGVKLLPRPLPPSATDVTSSKRTERLEDEEAKEEIAESVESFTPRDLLDIHVRRAKRIRAQLKDDRLQRIERFKQRLALLLPPPTDHHRNSDAVPGS